MSIDLPRISFTEGRGEAEVDVWESRSEQALEMRRVGLRVRPPLHRGRAADRDDANPARRLLERELVATKTVAVDGDVVLQPVITHIVVQTL